MIRRLSTLALLIGLAAHSQSQTEPAFDVASVKLATGTRTSGYNHMITPTGLTMLHVSMGHCLRLAYDIRTAYELVGPAWLDPPTENEYDIVAKVDRPVTEAEIRAMLRTLLAARFRLRAHRETRDLPVYALQTSKPSPALQPTPAQPTRRLSPPTSPIRSALRATPWRNLPCSWARPGPRVPSSTAPSLTGSYDFELDISRYVTDPDTGKPILDIRGAIDMEGALLRALPEQLGLVLKPQRAPYEVLVVDHVEKVPVEN